MLVFGCPDCGASMRFDASVEALSCPFCDGRQLIAEPDAGALDPSRVVAFAVGRTEASNRLRKWLATRWFRPSDLARRARVEELRGVHLPCWVFRSSVDACFTADTSPPPAGSRSDWFPVSGRYRGEVEELLVEASATLTARELEELRPFGLETAAAPGTPDPHAEVVEQFGIGRRHARLRAQLLLRDRCRQEVARSLFGSHRNLRVALRVTRLESEPVLLPVWVAAYRYRDRVHRLLVNGHTGAVTGEAPLSPWKIAVALLALLLLVLLLLQLRSGA